MRASRPPCGYGGLVPERRRQYGHGEHSKFGCCPSPCGWRPPAKGVCAALPRSLHCIESKARLKLFDLGAKVGPLWKPPSLQIEMCPVREAGGRILRHVEINADAAQRSGTRGFIHYVEALMPAGPSLTSEHHCPCTIVLRRSCSDLSGRYFRNRPRSSAFESRWSKASDLLQPSYTTTRDTIIFV